MPRFALTAVGADRPGIVAAVTGVLVDLGANLEDSSMTILRGNFAMMLVVDAPAGVTAGSVEAALAPPAAAHDLVVTVRPLAEVAGGAPPARTGETAEAEEPRYTLAVYGADHPGIVHGVAAMLAAEGVNIVDLSTRVIGGPERPVYAMVLEVALPAGADPDALGRRLSQVAAELGVDASLHASDADIL